VSLWLKIAVAAVLGFMVMRLWPVAKHLNQNGPKGNAHDWQAALLPIALVAGFVVLLVLLVRH
jgi:hypothetical protein